MINIYQLRKAVLVLGKTSLQTHFILGIAQITSTPPFSVCNIHKNNFWIEIVWRGQLSCLDY